MKKNEITTNAKKAYNEFREELGEELGVDVKKQLTKTTKKIMNKAEEMYNNLGRS